MRHLTLALIVTSFAMASENERYGVIAKTEEAGKPVILNISTSALNDLNRDKCPWLAIIAWKYEGGAMPTKEVNAKMIRLEDAIEHHIVKNEHCIHAVSRTGNGLKEWEYYIKDREDFISRFNRALADQEHYPVEITFYRDPEWRELKRFIAMLKKEG